MPYIIMVLSLDLSTACCGVSLFTDAGELFFSDFVDLNESIKNHIAVAGERNDFDILMQKAEVVVNYVHKKITTPDYDLTDVVIEAPLMGSNNAKTVVLLAKFNAMVSLRLSQEFVTIPYHISITDWRKYAFPDVHRHKGDNVKQLYADAVMEKYPDIQLTYTKRGKLDKRNYDMLDSIGIGLGWFAKRKAENQ